MLHRHTHTRATFHGPPGSEQPLGAPHDQAHTGLPGAPPHPGSTLGTQGCANAHTRAHTRTHTRAHTQRGDRRLQAGAGRLLCCSCPRPWGGGWGAPAGERPCEEDGCGRARAQPQPGRWTPGPPARRCPGGRDVRTSPSSTWRWAGRAAAPRGKRPSRSPGWAARTLASPRPAGASPAPWGWQ